MPFPAPPKCISYTCNFVSSDMTPPIRLFACWRAFAACWLQGVRVLMSTDSGVLKDAFIDSVLNTLTLEDKAGEMTQLTLDMVCVKEGKNVDEPHRLDPEKLNHVLVDLRVGSILNCWTCLHSGEMARAHR